MHFFLINLNFDLIYDILIFLFVNSQFILIKVEVFIAFMTFRQILHIEEVEQSSTTKHSSYKTFKVYRNSMQFSV